MLQVLSIPIGIFITEQDALRCWDSLSGQWSRWAQWRVYFGPIGGRFFKFKVIDNAYELIEGVWYPCSDDPQVIDFWQCQQSQS